MRDFDAVIFDLDGTLIDSYGPITEAANAARQAFGLPPLTRAAMTRHVGRGLEALLGDFVGAGNVPEAVALFRARYGEIFLDGTVALPGAASTLRALSRAGLRLAVASNKPARFGRPIVEHLGFAGDVSLVLGPSDDVPPKPDPRMLSLARARLGASAERTLYVGDMPLDVESARQAGLPHVLVPTGSAPVARLLEVRGAWLVSHLADVERFISPGRGGLHTGQAELDTPPERGIKRRSLATPPNQQKEVLR